MRANSGAAIRVYALLTAVLLSGALLVAAGCASHSPAAGPMVAGGGPANGAVGASEFAGSAACAECHPREFESHSHTNHAKTLRPADTVSLGSLAPPAGPIADSAYLVRRDGKSIRFARRDRPDISAAAQYALGAGKTVITFIGEVTPDSLTEFRMSYAPASGKWFVTPGHETIVNVELGRKFELEMASRCILCHGDKVDAKTGNPAAGFIGIGCESCHGPGSSHIGAVKSAGSTDIRMERLGQVSGARINEICGRCHRSTPDVELTESNACNTMRFQPYGLERSPCFQKSGGKLSCVTCHDPHKDASTNVRRYEQICRSCHSPAVKKAAVCPVNARDKCVGCHMPKREILPGTSIPLKMSDHLIWAYRPHKSSAP